MYESDQCQASCTCYTCINTSCHHARNCSNPFKCRLMHITCSSQQQVGQYRCTIIAGPNAGHPGIITKEGELNTIRSTIDGSIQGLREDEIIRD